MGPEGEPVDDRRGEARVGEGLAPLTEGVVAGHRDRGAFLALGEYLEQQLGAAGIDADISELVDAEQVESSVAADGPGEHPFVGGLGEFVDQLGGGDVK